MRIRLRSAKDVEGELRLLENSLERIRQSFILEKDSALSEGRIALEHLREREKSHYQPVTARMISELRQLRYLSERVEELPSSIFLRMNELEKGLKEARAHFTGTVNRLMRCPELQSGDDECTE